MPDSSPQIRIDIVSDVVCPWCIIGYRQLERAMAQTGISAGIRWHPFELNPNMPEEGQNLREHIMQKYGSSAIDSDAARDRLTALGAELGFVFRFAESSRMVNTFRAHQMIEWADENNRQHDMQMALFTAYFSDARDVSDPDMLADIAAQAGFDRSQAQAVLADGRYGANVRAMQQFWAGHGITGVPAMVFQQKHLMTGAQGVEAYATLLRRLASEPAKV